MATLDLPHLKEMADDLPPDSPSKTITPPMNSGRPPLKSLEALESAYLRWAHQRQSGDSGELARALGVSQRTLYRKLRAAGL